MKNKLLAPRRGFSRGLLVIALLLTVSAAACVPLSMSRYAVSAAIPAAADVALFDPVWIAENTANNGPGGLGALNSGIVVHPGSACWTGERRVNWRCTNNSEVMIDAYVVPKSATASKTGTTYSVGDYFPSNPARADFDTDGLQQGVSAAGFYGAVSWYDTAAKRIPIGDSACFGFSFTGYAAAPYRPANSNASNNVITQAAPIRFDAVGTAYTVSDMGSTWWRAYRINLDGFAVQVD